jgi:hypothetical protein
VPLARGAEDSLSEGAASMSGMSSQSDADRAVAAVLRKQGGLITRPQALAAGWTVARLRHRIRTNGPWRAVLPGIYLSTNGPLAAGQREIAAALYAGPNCVLTGPAALRQYGLRVPTTELIDVLVPASAKRQSVSFVRMRRTTRLPDQTFTLDGIRWAEAARAIADTARNEFDLREVRALVAGAVQDGTCTIGQLAQELRAGPSRESGRLRAVLEEVADGVRSAAEGDLRLLIKRSGLPEPMYNPDLYLGSVFLGRPDTWWKDAGVAGEVDSREWHYSPDQWEKTMARHSRMTAHGISVMHFTPKQVRTEPRRVVGEFRSAIEEGRKRPPLEIRAVPRR